MKNIVISIIIFSTMILVGCSSNNNHVYIISVHDGDTFTDNKGIKYRLFGVDTAEMSNQYRHFMPTVGIERIYAQEATNVTKKLIEKQNINISVVAIDRYGRRVAKISRKGIDLASLLIKKGYARVAYMSLNPKDIYFTKDSKYFKHLLDLQYIAFQHHVGFWERQEKLPLIFPKAII